MIEAMARGATIRRFRPGERERLRLAGRLLLRNEDAHKPRERTRSCGIAKAAAVTRDQSVARGGVARREVTTEVWPSRGSLAVLHRTNVDHGRAHRINVPAQERCQS
jgi:hypothetical protein